MISGGYRRVTALALAGAVLAGCAAPQSQRLERERPANVPVRAHVDAVPFFPQERYQCGPAALATVLVHRGVDTTPAALVEEVYLPARRGSLQAEMRAAVRARGLVPYPLAPRLTALLTEVAAGRPVLVLQNLGLDWIPRWHYAVVVEYDLAQDTIVLRSGTVRRRETGLANFERTWARGDHWAQVVVPPDEPPATAEPTTWLRAVRELETTGQAAAARTGYRAATRRWPEHAAAWMARGNAAWAADDPGEARAAFRRAVTIAPDDWTGWNNLAYALAATGAPDGAVAAASCATRLAPDQEDPRDTLEELGGDTGSPGSLPRDIPTCPIPADD